MVFTFSECVILTSPFFAPLLIGAVVGFIRILINK